MNLEGDEMMEITVKGYDSLVEENRRLREALEAFCDAYDKDDGMDGQWIVAYMKAREFADKVLLGGK